MAASVGNTSSGSANASSLAVAHTLGTGSDLVLVVSLGYSSGSNPTSVVWDPDGVNEALSLVSGAQGRSGAVTAQIWELVNPSAATGSGEVVVTFGGKTNQGFGVATLLGAGAGSDGTGNTAVQTLTVSNAGADDIIIDMLRSDSNATIGANQTSFLDLAIGGKHYNASWQDGVDGGVMSWTGGGTTLRMAACRFPVAIADITVAVPLGTLDLTGFAPTVLENIRINVPAGSLNLTGFVPTVLEDTAIVVPPADTILDEYPFSNGSTSVSLSSDNLDGVGQSFTGNGKNIASAVFELHRVGSPTGNAVCKIYAHSGTFGTSSIPTGAALATSENFDVSTLTAGPAEYKINFPTPFFTVDGTKYVVTFEYSGGDTPNRVQLGIDTSSPTHSGNYSDIVNPGSWTANSARDVVFEIHFKGSLNLKGYVPTTVETTIVNVPTGNLTLGSFAPTLKETIIVPAAAGSEVFDTYAFSNNNGTISFGSTLTQMGQSFTGTGEKISSVEVEITKSGSPTGPVVAKLYTHTGTFGSSSEPNVGGILATSLPIYAEDIGILSVRKFIFPVPFKTVNGTKYCWLIEHLTSDPTNRVSIDTDSVGTHEGNYFQGVETSWTPSAARDIGFILNTNLGITLTGLPVVLDVAVTIPLGTLTLTGFAPTPVETAEDVTIDVPTGSLTLTGFVPLPGENVVVNIPVGNLTLTGFVPSFSEGVNVNVPSGSLTLVGFAVIPGENVVEIIPVASLTLTGFAPSAVENTIVNVPVGSLSLTGFIPGVSENVNIPIPLGSLTLTGFVPVAFENTSVSVPAGNLTLTGFAPTPGENVVVTVPVGSLTLTGLVPVAQTEVVIDIPTASLSLTGFPVTHDISVGMNFSSISLTGFAPAVVEGTIINVPTGSLTLTGFAPVPGEDIVVAVGTGALTLTGFAPHVVEDIVEVPVGSLALTGFAPTAVETVNVEVPTGSLTLTGFVPTFSIDTIIDVPVGSLTLTGFVPVTIFNIILPVPAGALTLTGLVPTLDISVIVPQGNLTLSGFAPSVVITTVVNVPSATLTLSGFAPVASQDTTIEVPVGSLVLTGFVVTVIETANDITVVIPTGVLTFSGFAPASVIGGDAVVTPGVGILALIGFVPNVVLTIFNLESCDMDVIFPKNVDKLVVPSLQDIEFNLDRLKAINLPNPVDIKIEPFTAFEPVAPTKEVERIQFLYKDFANTIQTIIDGKIGELVSEVKPYDVEYIEWGRNKEDLLEGAEEAVETSFDGEAARGFVAPSGVFNKDLSKQSIKTKRTVSRANEQFFSEQNKSTLQNISAGLEAGNVAENVVRATDQQRQTINLQAVQNLAEIDFRVFEIYLQRHNSRIEVKRIKHQAWIEELKGKLLILQERELAIKGHTLNLIERTHQVEMFNASIDYLNAQQALKEIELDNFILEAELEKNKLLKFQAEVDKFSSLINLNISKFNLYKAGIEFEESKVDKFQQEAAVASAQLRVQAAKTDSGQVVSNTKINIAQAKLNAQLEKLRAARTKLETVLTEGRIKGVGFNSDLLIYQSDLRDWLTEISNDVLEITSQVESKKDFDLARIKDGSRLETGIIRVDTEAQNIKDLAALNSEVIATSADITAKTEITSKLVHTLAGG